MSLSTLWIPEKFTYSGTELSPHFILQKTRIEGSALISWRGGCQVATEHLVDWEDRLAQDRIQAKEMVHFLGEFFLSGLREGVLRQRLLVSIAHDVLRFLLPGRAVEISREGDDLFWASPDELRKLSVSIVTSTPVSQLLHFAVNVDSEGAPVPAAGLKDLGVDPERFAAEVMKRFSSEWASVERACVKVRPVV